MIVKGVINIVSHLIGLDKRYSTQQKQQNKPITITISNYTLRHKLNYTIFT